MCCRKLLLLAVCATVATVAWAETVAQKDARMEWWREAGNDWKTTFTGITLGDDFQRSFSAVTSHDFRLKILDATQGPTLNEIELQPE